MDPNEQTPQTAQAPDPAALALQAELAEMKRQLAAERTERIKAEAAAYVEYQVRDSRLLPAEATHYTALYAQLAQDDTAAPLASGSRLDLLRGAVGARPQHTRAEEQLPATAAVLPAAGESPTAEEAGAKNKRRKALLSKTAEGRAILAQEQ